MKKYQQGITLLESLIALLVLSIGLLGTAHLMATGIQQSNGSLSRMQASYIAQNLAERMRANPIAVADLKYNNFDSDDIGSCTARPAAYCQAENGTEPASCTADELATFDLYQASCGASSNSNSEANGVNGLKDLLPDGRLQITCSNASCNETSAYNITVSWSEIVRKSDSADEINTKSIRHIIRP